MFGFFYEIAIQKTLLFAKLIALGNRRVANFFKARAQAEALSSGDYKWWVHCASYGEFEMALPLIHKLKQSDPQSNILVTFFSPSGYEQLKGKHADVQMCYAPLDTRKAVRRFYERYHPKHALFVRYELWYRLLREGLDRGVAFHLINARLSSKHFIFRIAGSPYQKLLKRFSSVSTSDEKTADLLRSAGINASFTGDTRYDRVNEIRKQAQRYDLIERFKGDQPLLIMGSTYFYEERIVQEVLHDLARIKLIIAPHTVDEHRIQEIETLFSEYKPKRWSAQDITANDQLLILDSIGMLSSVYQYADVAFVGGGFTGALHNIIEPAVWGAYIFFGPLIQKFPEAKSMVSAGIAAVIRDGEDLKAEIDNKLMDSATFESIRKDAQNFVAQRLGASDQVFECLFKNMEDEQAAHIR